MRCQTCATFNTEATNYCKQCGSQLLAVPMTNAALPVVRPKQGGIAWLIALAFTLTAGVGLGGLVLVMILTMELARVGIPVPALSFLGLASLLMLCGTVALIGRQISRLIGIYQQTSLPSQTSNVAFDSIRPPSQINAFCEPAMSVTEHTTRTLASASYRE